MRWEEVSAPNFDLTMTLNSGQVFHWEKIGDGFCGTIGDRAIYVEQCRNILRAKVEGGALQRRDDASAQPGPRPATAATVGSRELAPPSAVEIVRNYFALDHPLDEICASFPQDPVMNAARDFCRGLRIIRQPKWECLATFICSSMKQVRHIRQISQALRQRFGKKREICSHEAFSFPSPDRLARTSEAELRKCGLGYRAGNLLATARLVASREVDLNSWKSLADKELLEQLCDLPGVGAKVANCVMLFAYERIEAFPIDVWIERVLRQKYFPKRRKATRVDLAEFATKYFGPCGGYAQQYLFHQARMTRRKR